MTDPKQLRILVVDDHVDSAGAMGKALTSMGYQSTTATGFMKPLS
jgi:CheY-like chemotaxis protein